MKKLLFFFALWSVTPFAFGEETTSSLLPHQEIQSFIEAKIEAGEIDQTEEDWRTRLPKFPDAAFPDEVRYQWVLDTTEGVMTFRLNHADAPEHVRNILYLTQLGFYDGLNFHRIIPGFMAQGGCPLGRGTGNPGYFLNLEADPRVKHDEPGVLSMARSSRPDSAGSQFFITFGQTAQLDGEYTVFGRMTDGREVLKKLEAAGDPRANGMHPKKNIVIRKAEIRTADAPPAPNE